MQKDFLEFTYGCVSIKTPIYTFTGTTPGPHLIISGGMHGNEINGIIICDKIKQLFITTQIEEHLHGSISIVPILNPLGFDQMTRYVPIDGKDLNRCFGVDDDTQKSFSIAYAAFLFESLRKHANHGIDIHDAGGRSALIPHPRIHMCDTVGCNNCTHEMAKRFDSKIVLERQGDTHMLASYCYEMTQIPVMTLELGGGQLLFTQFFDETIRGIYNILYGYGYLPGKPILTQQKQRYLTERDYYKAKEGGYFVPEVELGQYVNFGQKIGSIYYLYSDTTEIITAKESGFLFSLWCGHQIPAGSNLFSLLSDDTTDKTI